MKLSILLSGIRTHNWHKLYKSIQKAFSGSWELIIVSPYALPEDMYKYDNISYCKDLGSAMRCQQIALTKANGDYVTWTVDDGEYVEGSLDKAFSEMTSDVICLKYTEWDRNITFKNNQDMEKESFYYIKHHLGALDLYVPHWARLLNFAIIKRDLIVRMGGWDCQFESLALGELDFAIRVDMLGIDVGITKDIVLNCDWMPGIQGDHAPMHFATLSDEPLYHKIYSDVSCGDRVFIDINNWEKSTDFWSKRFGIKEEQK